MFRLLNRAYAWLFGYFWLPCPVCGKCFGGHEASWAALVVDKPDGEHAYCVCPNPACAAEADRRNSLRYGYRAA